MTRLPVALVSAALVAVASCAPIPSPEPDGLAVDNDTSIEVILVVNGTAISRIPAHTESDKVPASGLPDLPWEVDVTNVAGRSLISLDVNASDWLDAPNGEVGVDGQSHREDLPCGALEVWAGIRPGGPPDDSAGPSVPASLCD